MKWHDKLAIPISEFLTSTLFVVIVMLSFMFGIVTHLANVFDSWFLAIGFQSVVLVASVNSAILPTITIESKYDPVLKKDVPVKTLPAIALIMSIFMLWFISIDFGAIDFAEKEEWLNFTISITKAIAVSSMELMFSYLFDARWTTDRKRLNITDLVLNKKPDTQEMIQQEPKPRVSSSNGSYI